MLIDARRRPARSTGAAYASRVRAGAVVVDTDVEVVLVAADVDGPVTAVVCELVDEGALAAGCFVPEHPAATNTTRAAAMTVLVPRVPIVCPSKPARAVQGTMTPQRCQSSYVQVPHSPNDSPALWVPLSRLHRTREMRGIDQPSDTGWFTARADSAPSRETRQYRVLLEGLTVCSGFGSESC
jgi:hypothetical protein